jgi:hypothetical protein
MLRATLLTGFLTASLLAPCPGRSGEVLLTADDLFRAEARLWFAPDLALPAPDTTLPFLGARNDEDGATLLRNLSASDRINGFSGILYDNRDRGHSELRGDLFPRLARLKYGPELRMRSLDYGLAGQIILPAVVLGNSSTAITGGPAPRSQTRLAMTRPGLPEASALLYERNAIYVYPEHRDHDAEDRFPANWPYMVTSQGSSGSDRPFLRAIAMTLAAFPKETFDTLRDRGLIAPTVQMILRRNLATVVRPPDYFRGAAHPVVFDSGLLRPGRMVAHASSMRPDEIPPMVRLRVLDETFSDAAGLAAKDEHLFDTPSAIARIWRSFDWSREITVTAEDSADPNDRPLTYVWRLLQGDPGRVRIEPLDPDGRSARIRINWQDPVYDHVGGAADPSTRKLSRVDIGVFAGNGINYSAPAFISVAFPGHQRRLYDVGGNGSMRLVSIDYDAISRDDYYDPLLFWSAPWTDIAAYDGRGALLGWERQWHDGRTAFVPLDENTGTAPHYRVDASQARQPELRYD